MSESEAVSLALLFVLQANKLSKSSAKAYVDEPVCGALKFFCTA